MQLTRPKKVVKVTQMVLQCITMPIASQTDQNKATQDDAFQTLHPSEETIYLLMTSAAEKITNGDRECQWSQGFYSFCIKGQP